MSTQISLSRPIKLEVNVTPITGGSAGQILFQTTGNTVGESANLFWDNTNGRLGIGTSSPTTSLDVNGTARIQSGLTVANTGNYAISASKGATTGLGSQYFNNGGTLYWGVNDSSGSFLLGTNGLAYAPFFTSTTSALQLGTNATARLTIFPTTGNIGINTTTDAGFKLDVNGTARVNNMFSVTNASFTGSLRMESFANNQQRIIGGPSENITFGSGNTITLNTGEAYFSGSLLGNAFWMTSNGSTVIGAQANPPASALVEIRSTTKGFLPPRMTTTQKNAIATPATGLMVYDTTLNLISVYNGTTWITL